MDMLIEVFASVLLLVAAFFALVGAIGLVRLPDFLCDCMPRLRQPHSALAGFCWRRCYWP